MQHAFSSYFVDANMLLSQLEIDKVVDSLTEKAKTSKTAHGNLVLFILLTKLGLRISEALNISLKCICLECDNPHVVVPAAVAKLGKMRVVPLWSSLGLRILKEFKDLRRSMGAKDEDVFFCSLSKGNSYGKKIARQVAGRRYKSMMRSALSAERSRELHCHSSRHTFISACLARNVSIVETQRAAGHASLNTVSLYSHLFKDRNAKSYNID